MMLSVGPSQQWLECGVTKTYHWRSECQDYGADALAQEKCLPKLCTGKGLHHFFTAHLVQHAGVSKVQ